MRTKNTGGKQDDSSASKGYSKVAQSDEGGKGKVVFHTYVKTDS
jgi:hypothetical protein